MVEEEQPPGPDPLRSAAAVTVLTIDERLPASADLGELVERAAGANVQRMGGLGDFSAVSVRGSDLRQVQVFIDGVPLNPDGSNVVNLSELPLRAFSRVELWRGNAPPELAASPIGGAINLIPAEEPPPLSVGAMLGSYTTTRLDALVATPQLMAYAEAFNTRGDFLAFSDNGTPYNRIDDTRTLRGNNDKAQVTTFARLSVPLGPAELSLLDAWLDREEGLPGPARSPASAARLATRQNLAVAQARAPLGPVQARARIWSQVRQESLWDPEGELGAANGASRDRFSSTGLLLHAALPRPQLTSALTLSARGDRALRLAPALEDPRQRRSYTAAISGRAYLYGERLRPELVLQGTALDNRRLGEPEALVTPADQRWVFGGSPRLAIAWNPSEDLVIRAGAGRYFRPPDLTELFGDRGYLIGNPTLLPEAGWQADLGLRWAFSGAFEGMVELGGFGSYVEDRIVLVQNAQSTSVPINFGLSRTLGLEAAASLRAFEVLELDSSLTLTDATNLTPGEAHGKRLPRVPLVEISHSTSVVWEERARLGHTWTYAAGNALDATNWTWSAPRSIHGAFLRVQPLASGVWVELSALNLTNRIAETAPLNPLDPADPERVVLPLTDFVDYPLPGRTWTLSVRWPQ